MNKNRFIKISITVIVIMSMVISILIMLVAIDHNPMQEYCILNDKTNEYKILWSNLLPLGGLWFILAFLIGAVIASFVWFAINIIEKKNKE